MLDAIREVGAQALALLAVFLFVFAIVTVRERWLSSRKVPEPFIPARSRARNLRGGSTLPRRECSRPPSHVRVLED